MTKKTLSLVGAFVLIIFIIMLSVQLTMMFIGYIAFHFRPSILNPHSHFSFVITTHLCSLVACTFTAFVFSKIVLRPILKLNDAMLQVSKGDFSVKLNIDSSAKEINQMGASFNKMVDGLNSIEMFRNDFVSNVSHELKTPLANIEGYVTLLQDKNLSVEERDEYLDILFQNTRKLSNLTRNILSLTKLDTSQFDTEKTLFRLDEQIRGIIIMLEPMWSEKHIDFDIDLEKINFYGTEEYLFTVWKNLIENAIKFSYANGRISISLKKLSHQVVFSVADNGIGMSEEIYGHIFEKFYQGDKAHHTQGNGLGLALVKKIVDIEKGSVDVKSAEGKGSVFTVTLPVIENLK